MIRVKKRACYQCAIGCRNFHATTYRGAEVRGEGPEYETIALCGANCGIDDIDALAQFNAECDEWGLDTVTSGAVVGLAMDMAKKGIKDFGLRFGDGESYVQAPGLVARREGIGDELALGTRALAAKYGCPELAMQVKGLELPGYDPRGSFGMSIAYATSDRGGCHMRAYPVGPEVLSGSMPPDSLVGKAAFCIEKQHFNAVKFSAVLCDFWAIAPQQLCLLFERLRGRPFSEQEILDIGERVWNLGRLFNLREDVERDEIPALQCESTESSFGAPRKPIGQEALHAALQEYYALRGWNEHGVPTEEKLAAIGVDVRLPTGMSC